ncbi:MAG: F0F1 ATP synthase subunit B family protein [Thermoanaerobaculia bacterium]
MRHLLAILAIVLVATFALAEDPKPTDSLDGASTATAEAQKATHGEAAAEEHHEDVYFGFIPGSVLKFINIVLFIGVIVWAVKGPVMTAFAARTEEIKRQAVEARERREKADQLAGDIQARLTQIETEVVAIRQRAEAEGERQSKELIAAAQAEATKILASARNEVDNRLKFARKELTEYAGELAAERAEAILREKITPEDQRKLFRDSLTQVGEA